MKRKRKPPSADLALAKQRKPVFYASIPSTKKKAFAVILGRKCKGYQHAAKLRERLEYNAG